MLWLCAMAMATTGFKSCGAYGRNHGMVHQLFVHRAMDRTQQIEASENEE
jgi:hypothetical protein